MEPPRGRLLLLVDRPGIRAELTGLLTEAGFRVEACGGREEVVEAARSGGHDLLLCLPGIGDRGALDLLEELAATPRLPPVVLLGPRLGAGSGAAGPFGSIERIPWPQAGEDFVLAVDHLLQQQRLRGEVRHLRERLEIEHSLDHLVARDGRMLAAFEQVRAVAPTRATVLVCGESGTGKSLLAQAIHRLSDRADRPFVTVSCGSIPEPLLESELFGHIRGAFTGAYRDRPGRFEDADGGTLFLDEIGSASPALQVKLLRFLQDRTFERVGESRTRRADVRLIFASNTSLREAVERGEFRRDLLFRIEVIRIDLPPLRERPSDIMPLIRHLLSRLAADYERPVPRISRPAARLLLQYSWPGNVRELANCLERGLLLSQGGTILPEHLPPAVVGAGAVPADSIPLPRLVPGRRYRLKDLLAEPERRILRAAIEACDGNRERAAAMLGIDRSTLYARMRRLGMTRNRRGRPGQGSTEPGTKLK
ncbi:MAG: sigma-54-dependent Fis family transcriptional regulator [Planctomycetota bacterium]|nr:MAG: sigma-54-dependent Fis family transcriptional regulator [Planctomycetota bacterium]